MVEQLFSIIYEFFTGKDRFVSYFIWFDGAEKERWQTRREAKKCIRARRMTGTLMKTIVVIWWNELGVYQCHSDTFDMAWYVDGRKIRIFKER